MGCATSLVKYIVFIFNFLFVLAAIAFIVVGVLIKLGLTEVITTLDSLGIPFSIAPILMIIVGVVVFVISFFGCCGAIKESTCMLTTYAVILLVLLIAQVAVGIYAFIQIKDSSFNEADVSKALKKVIDDYYNNDEIKEAVDVIQSESECCGAESYRDWTKGPIPPSCCKHSPPTCDAQSAYQRGCAQLTYNFITKSIEIIGIVIITIAAVELVGAIVALCLSSSIRNHERRGQYA